MGLSPNIRIYRYKPKQFFDAHCRLNLAQAQFLVSVTSPSNMLLGYLAVARRSPRPVCLLSSTNLDGQMDRPRPKWTRLMHEIADSVCSLLSNLASRCTRHRYQHGKFEGFGP